MQQHGSVKNDRQFQELTVAFPQLLLYLIIMQEKKYTTKEAVEMLISKRAWYKPLGLPEGTGRALAARYKSGEMTIDKMEELLTKAGLPVLQEKLWGNKE
jgi:flagellar basal body rod protein FlgG